LNKFQTLNLTNDANFIFATKIVHAILVEKILLPIQSRASLQPIPIRLILVHVPDLGFADVEKIICAAPRKRFGGQRAQVCTRGPKVCGLVRKICLRKKNDDFDGKLAENTSIVVEKTL
jgi:hypothetical protein